MGALGSFLYVECKLAANDYYTAIMTSGAASLSLLPSLLLHVVATAHMASASAEWHNARIVRRPLAVAQRPTMNYPPKSSLYQRAQLWCTELRPWTPLCTTDRI